MKYVVSRQRYWGEDERNGTIVEVACGGIDYSGPDAFCAHYPGELCEYNDPREAVEVALEICRRWRKDGEKNAKIAVGHNNGFTWNFEPTTFKAAIQWAKKMYEKLPKCPQCGELRVEGYGNDWTLLEETGDDRYPFCSEYCAENHYVARLKADCEDGFHYHEKHDLQRARDNHETVCVCQHCGKETDIDTLEIG